MKSISILYKEKEPGVDISLKNLSRIADPEFGLVKFFNRNRQYYDEPKFWNFSATLNSEYSKNDGRDFDSRASGFSFFSAKDALLKCLGESVERYCNFVFLERSTSFIGSFKQIKNKALDPNSISGFSKRQLKKQKFKRFRITEYSKFRWTKCISLINGESVLVPSQLIYLSYPLLQKEPIIYFPISTGVAGGSCLSGALMRAIYEVIERDAFMIYYLNKLQAPRIQLKLVRNGKVKEILRIADRYKLEIVSLDITTNLGVPTIASIVFDRTGIGKAVSVGLKSNLNSIDALIGSMSEAFHTRSWLRGEYEKNPKKIRSHVLLKHSDLKTRGLLWYPTEAISNLDFWIKNPKIITIREKDEILSSGTQLKRLLLILSNFDYKVYYKDLTAPWLKGLNYFVAKVIIPQMQPLYLNENYPLLGGERLYAVPKKLGYKPKTENELNKYPHPFL